LRHPFRRLVVTVASLACCLLAAEQYNERYRPQFHFSPRANWTNDPCGLVYAFGKYHLFFQHNPVANVWGHMSWGHAVSTDLIHWTQLPVAIPDDEKAAIFTGSSVVDARNTSGLCPASPQGCIVSIYTGYTPKTPAAPERQTQNLAFSRDGLTWTKYASNPILDLGRSDTRDPKVFWHAPTQRWIMIIVLANEKKVRLFSSPNLLAWQHLSDFGPQGATGGVWECPDLIPLPVQGKPGLHRWVLKIGLNPGHIAGGSGEQYFVGEFDGTSFRSDNAREPIHWVDYGRDCYCALTFNHDPKPEAPRMLGWMNNWLYAGNAPTTPWRGSMTLPRSLSLAESGGSMRLLQRPDENLHALRQEAFRYDGASISDLNRKLSEWAHHGQTFEIEASLWLGQAKQIEWKLLQGENDETIVGFDAPKAKLYVDRAKSANARFDPAFPSKTEAPLDLEGKPLLLHIFVDRSSIEVFAQDGLVAMTNLVYPQPSSTGLSLSTTGSLEKIQFRMWALQSIWNQTTN
jgi:fructan beta-fructosidase